MAYRKVEAGQGVAWFKESWQLFMRAPLLIFGQILLILLLGFVTSMLPLFGPLAASIFGPVLLAGFFFTLADLDQGRMPLFSRLFDGFQALFKPLAILGLIMLGIQMLAAMLLMASIGALMGFQNMPGAFGSSDAILDPTFIMGLGGTAILLFLLLLIPLAMAFYFAVPLVAIAGKPPVEALKERFDAVLVNWPAFLVFSLVYLVLAVLASIPFGLGWLLLGPLLLVSIYVAFRNIFTLVATPPSLQKEQSQSF